MNVIARICLHNAACDDGVTIKRLRSNAADHAPAKELLAVMAITATTMFDATKRRLSEDSTKLIWEHKEKGETLLSQKIAMQLLEVEALDVMELRRFHQWWANVAPNMTSDFEAFRIITRGDITQNQQPLAQPPKNDTRAVYVDKSLDSGAKYEAWSKRGFGNSNVAPPKPPTQRVERNEGASRRYTAPHRSKGPRTRFCHKWAKYGECPKKGQLPQCRHP